MALRSVRPSIGCTPPCTLPRFPSPRSLFYPLCMLCPMCPPSQTINDWYDREIDAINEPYRPIPSGG